jgi:hypothetical protein
MVGAIVGALQRSESCQNMRSAYVNPFVVVARIIITAVIIIIMPLEIRHRTRVYVRI